MTDNLKGEVIQVSGPLVKAKGMSSAKVYEIVKVSEFNLMGEVIELNGDVASIQVYEETAGVGPGAPVTRTGRTMSVELGPGLLYSLYDGVQRPLQTIEEKAGSPFITRGIDAPALSREKKWEFTPVVKKDAEVTGGDVLGTVPETTTITHKVMVPPGIKGTVKDIGSGSFLITDDIATIETENGEEKIQMLQYWPIREARPKREKIFPTQPLITGIRTIDTFFPITKGGAGCIPGPFGAGKSVTQQWFAKYSDAQVIVYIGCGERGNEMTEAVTEFPELKDPNTGEPLMNRTVLIANTSNMPVAAREASVYSGITIAEYYRDMGYSVALMADSTSRWAEAMREISGRLEEMPGEEGYPAYLASRTAEFYERAGIVECLGDKEDRVGALTVIGAVSPPGGDLSEPVSQSTLRVTKCFWSLDAVLQYKKHFPAINWLQSYSLYTDNLEPWWKENIAPDFADVRKKALDILQRESELQEIVKLVGMDALSNDEKLVLEIARSLREDYLFQSAFDPDDVYTPLRKQYEVLKSIMAMYELAQPLMASEEFEFKNLKELESFKNLPSLKTLDKENLGEYEKVRERMKAEVEGLAKNS